MWWLKGLCRLFCFLIPVWLTTYLIKAPNEHPFIELVLIMILAPCAWYGWSEIDGKP